MEERALIITIINFLLIIILDNSYCNAERIIYVFNTRTYIFFIAVLILLIIAINIILIWLAKEEKERL